MANLPSTATAVASNPLTVFSPQNERAVLIDGLVHHGLMTASVQVKILAAIDDHGEVTIGELIALLSDHPEPVDAILTLVDLTLLELDRQNRPLDARTIVRRLNSNADCFAPALLAAPERDIAAPLANADEPDEATSLPAGLFRLDAAPFAANVIIGRAADRREFGRLAELAQPGIYGLMTGTTLYVGTGSDVGQRVATGQQPIEGIETIFAIADANNRLTAEEACVAERILWSRAAASRERKMVNRLPSGSGVDPHTFTQIDAFVAEACLALRQYGTLFTTGSARSVLAGPRAEPGRTELPRPFNDLPDGQVMELVFNEGRVALAARRSEEDWTLLQGSEIRPDVVQSATSSARFLRAAWLHSGILALSPDGRSYVLKKDMHFRSAGAAAHFVTGSKGRGRGGWQPIDPDGGFDAETARLIAS